MEIGPEQASTDNVFVGGTYAVSSTQTKSLFDTEIFADRSRKSVKTTSPCENADPKASSITYDEVFSGAPDRLFQQRGDVQTGHVHGSVSLSTSGQSFPMTKGLSLKPQLAVVAAPVQSAEQVAEQN